MCQFKSLFYWIGIVIAAVIFYLCLNVTGVSQIKFLLYMGLYKRLAVWVVCYIIFFILFILNIIILNGWRLYVFIGLFSLSTLINIIYASLVGPAAIDQDIVMWMMDQKAGLRDVFSEFFGTFAKSFTITLGAIGLLLAWRSTVRHNSGIASWVMQHGMARGVVLTSFLSIHLLVYYTRPLMLANEINIPILVFMNFFNTEPEPGVVNIPLAVRNNPEKIVLVVDESVRSDIFQKMLADTIKGLPYFDYGEAAATVPCSGGSNALLRWGIDQNRVTNLDYDPRKSIFIWSYAKRAGYKTVLIDGQKFGHWPQNFMGRKESLLIDDDVLMNQGDAMDIDVTIAKELKQRFLNHDKEFIYVVKRGAHFPYEHCYPTGNLSDQGTRMEKNEEAVRYSTGRFFHELKTGVDYSKAFIVYTSDHGEMLQEGSPGHCRSDSAWEQFSVPLVILTNFPQIRQTLAESLAMVRGHASHEQIFPTLLYAMGYLLDSNTIRYAAPLYKRWDRYTVLRYPFIPLAGRHTTSVSFQVFKHFPYRVTNE